MSETNALAAAPCQNSRPVKVKTGNALLLGLLGLTVVSCLAGSRAVHVTAGVLFAGLTAHHVWKRRKAV